MLFFYYTGRRRENTEGGLALPRVARLTSIEKSAEKFRPWNSGNYEICKHTRLPSILH